MGPRQVAVASDLGIRLAAVKALGKTGLSDAIPTLIDALPAVRVPAVDALNVLTAGLNGAKPSPIKQAAAEQEAWRAWWEANKAKYPPGTKMPVPPALVQTKP